MDSNDLRRSSAIRSPPRFLKSPDEGPISGSRTAPESLHQAPHFGKLARSGRVSRLFLG